MASLFPRSTGAWTAIAWSYDALSHVICIPWYCWRNSRWLWVQFQVCFPVSAVLGTRFLPSETHFLLYALITSALSFLIRSKHLHIYRMCAGQTHAAPTTLSHLLSAIQMFEVSHDFIKINDCHFSQTCQPAKEFVSCLLLLCVYSFVVFLFHSGPLKCSCHETRFCVSYPLCSYPQMVLCS